METLESFDPHNRTTQKKNLNLGANTNTNTNSNTNRAKSYQTSNPSAASSSTSSSSSSDLFHFSAPDVSGQDLDPSERMESEGSPSLSSRLAGASHHRFDNSRRGSTGSAKADDELSRDVFRLSRFDRRRSDVHPGSKLQLQTEELETSGMSEMEIAEVARRRAEEEPTARSTIRDSSTQPESSDSIHQPVPGLSYAAVVKESAPSQGPSSSIPESILYRQAAEAVHLDHHRREVEKQMEIEQVQKKEDLLVPPTPLQHPIIPVRVNTEQAKIANQNLTKGIEEEEEQGGKTMNIKGKVRGQAEVLKNKMEGVAGGLKEKAQGLKHKMGEEPSQLKASLSSTLDQLSSSVSATSSPLQKGRESISHALSSVSDTVKSKLPWFGNAKETNEEERQEEEEAEEQEQPDQRRREANEMKDQVTEKKNQILSKAETLKNQAAEKKNQVASRLVNRGGEMKEQVAKKASELVERSNQMWDHGKQIASKKLAEGKQTAEEKVNQAKRLVPQANQSGAGKGQEKGHKSKKKANEMTSKNKEKEEEESVGDENKGSSSYYSLSPVWRNILSSVTERASHLKQQATETAAQLGVKVGEKIPNLSSMKSGGKMAIETGKKTAEQGWEVVGKSKNKLDKHKNQTADSLGLPKGQAVDGAESSGIMDHDHNLHFRDSIRTTLSNLSNKIQDQSQFQSLYQTTSPYFSRARSFSSSYLQSYQEFLSDLRDQNYVLQVVFGLMAVMHVFIPLLFLDYPQARMCIKWYSFVAIFSHAMWYFTRSIKLVQLPNILLYPLITYLLMMSPIIGEGLNSGTQSVTWYLSEWLSFLIIPLQARSYCFTLWLRTLLMLDTAVLTGNMMGLSSFINSRGGSIKQAFLSFLQSDEGRVLKKTMKDAKKEAKKIKRQLERGEQYEKTDLGEEDERVMEEGKGHETRHEHEHQDDEHDSEEEQDQQHVKRQRSLLKAKNSVPAPAGKVSALKQHKKPQSPLSKREKQSEHDKNREHGPDESPLSEEEHEQRLQHPHQLQQHQAPATKMKMKKKKPTKPQHNQQDHEFDKLIETEYDDRDRDEHRNEQEKDQFHERSNLMKWEDDPAPGHRPSGKSKLQHDHHADWSSGTGMTLSGDAATMAMQDWSMAK